MCQMRIILERNGKEETVLEDAAVLEVTGQGVTISTLFESPRVLEHVRLKKIDILGGKVVLVPGAEDFPS